MAAGRVPDREGLAYFAIRAAAVVILLIICGSEAAALAGGLL